MKKILIADPDHHIVLTLENLLRAESYEVFICCDSTVLMGLAGLHDFDLILVNSQMRTDEGRDAIPALQLKQPAALFIVILEDQGTDRTTLPNVFDQIRKPLDFPSIVSRIRQVFNGGGFSGIITGINLADYVQMLCMNRATKAILVRKDVHKGILLINDGRISYAEVAGFKGEEAFHEIISWQQGQIKDVKVKKFPPPNIDKDIQQLLLNSSLRLDESAEAHSPAEAEPAAEAVAALFDLPEYTFADDGSPEKNIRSKGIQKKGFVRKYAGIGVAVALVLLIGLSLSLQGLLNGGGKTEKTITVQNLSAGDTASRNTLAGNSQARAAAQEGTPAASGAGQESSGLKNPPDSSGGNAGASSVSATGHGDGPKAQASQEVPPLPEETLLRLHGSNTIGAVLAPALVTAYLKTRLNAVDITSTPGVKENEVTIRATIEGKKVAVEIQAHGSATAFEDLKAGTCDIGDASRKIKDKEIEQLSFLGDMTSPANEHVVGLDGIAVIVNKGNPVNTLSVHDLHELFAGNITGWRDAHGPDGAVNVYARDDKSGTYDTFKSIILGEQDPLAVQAKRYESNADLSDDVSRDPLGIGFTGLPYIRDSKALAVSEDGAQAIYPNFFTVATEDYPISRRLFMYTASVPQDPHVAPFIRFVLSAEGQKIVQESGFVDMNIRTFPMDPAEHEAKDPPPRIREYVNAVKNANRLSLNFRFRKNETVLDNRSVQDLDRIISFLANTSNRRIILAGFADNSGDYENNYRLAMARAQLVASELRARGILVGDVYSCGPENPVASNTTEQGKEKNRRVEVWLK